MRSRRPSPVADLYAKDVVRRMPGGRVVLDGITATFTAGSVTAVVAANGIGKSTLARVLAGVDRPDAGTVSRPSQAAYLLPERVPVLPGCSARTVTAALAPALAREGGREACVARLEAGLELLGFTHSGTTPLYRLSKGNVQKAYLAIAHALRPAVAVLDEPTTGLDSASAVAAGQVARELAAHGCVVVVTGHQPVPFADLQLGLAGGHLQALEAPERVFLVDLELGSAADDWRGGRLGVAYDVVAESPGQLRLRVVHASLTPVLRVALERGDAVVRVVEDRSGVC